MSGMDDAQMKLAWAKGRLQLLDIEIGKFANSRAFLI
jgi:hypothetical protein